VRIPLPKTGLSVEYDPFEFTALIQVHRKSSTLSLESRRDGSTRFIVRRVEPSNLPPELGDCFSRDLSAMEKAFGKIQVLTSRTSVDEERTVWESEGHVGARRIVRLGRGAVFVAGTGPAGDTKEIGVLLDSLSNSIREYPVTTALAGKASIQVFGSITRASDEQLAVCLDLLVGGIQSDIYLQSLVLHMRSGNRNIVKAVQGRQLSLYSRVLNEATVNWHSTAIPEGARVVVQLPVMVLPTNVSHDEIRLVANGWYEHGQSFHCETDLSQLIPGVELLRPVPTDWVMLNGPEEISNHRLAVTVKGEKLFAPQRGAIDFKAPEYPGDVIDELSELDAFPSFGQPVRAPCDGTVVYCRSDLPDLLPGLRDTENPRGNEICIARDDGLVIVLAHLRQRSVQVHEQERIKRGDLVAAIGNSGNTSEPHLHIHVADSMKRREANGALVCFVDT